ncbi:MAG TPA: SdrD B-like domain-containing protein [Arachidicoccus sp.]|nr:SdrD B-like domain-containing protein [Arachidicoccus sp.]
MKLIFLFSQFNLFAQNKIKGLQVGFANDSVKVTIGSTFENRLIFQNTGNQTLHLRQSAGDSLALIGLPLNFDLPAGAKQSYFVQYLATPEILRQLGPEVKVRYQSSNGIVKASFFLNSEEHKQFRLSSYTPEIFINDNNPALTVRLLCKNNGFKTISFTLRTQSYPQGILPVDKDRRIQLAPGEQRLIDLQLRNENRNGPVSDYYVDIDAVNDQKEVLDHYQVKVMELGNSRRMTGLSANDRMQMQHEVKMTYWQSSNNNAFVQVLANGAAALTSKDMLNYRVNYNGYLQPIRGNEVYDSYVEWKRPSLGVRAGSISENLDYPLFGQGVKADVQLGKGQSLSAMYVKQNYLLYSDIFESIPEQENWAIHYVFQPGAGKKMTDQRFPGMTTNKGFGPMELNYIYGKDPLTTTTNHLINGNASWVLDRHQLVRLEGGVSREYFLGEPARPYKNGFGIGLHYTGAWHKFNLVSDNYVSSAYYSGIRRGTVMLNERLDVNLAADLSAYLQYTKQQNKPSYLSNYYLYATQKSGQTSYAAGIAKNWSKLNIYFRPYYFVQSTAQLFLKDVFSIRSEAKRGELTMLLHLNNQGLSLTGDYGLVETNNPYMNQADYTSWRIMGNYSYQFFSFNTLLQHNPYYIMEEATPWQQGDYETYSLGPSVRFSLLRDKLKFSASNYLIYNGYQDVWTNNLQGALYYNFRKNVELSAEVNLNTYQQSFYANNSQFKFGIKKSFQQRNAPGKHSWSVQFFGDENANGVWDKGEKAVSGVIVNLKKAQVKADKDGKVVFTDLLPGSYTLQLVDGRGWNNLQPMKIELMRNARTQFGLIKSVLVQGQIKGKASRFENRMPSLEGIKIMAKDANGHEYSTFSNTDGQFSFHLPEGRFTFRIIQEDQTFQVEHPMLERRVVVGDNSLLIFEIVDQSRKVNIKEFN